MGNKIITEKDFWMCSMGNVPAQMQGTRKGTKKASGETYITVEDTSTSSWIDFGCKKYMLLMALIAAVAVVALAVVGVLTVATGGAALIALGAVAGLVGAAIGAVVGGLLCGQKIASKREWSGSKSDFVSQGSATITGAHTMVCAAGGTVSFAPQIKNWGQAIALGSANYIGGLMEGMMAGAAVGMGGAALSGGASALAGGGIRGLGQASLNFLKSMPRNFAVNAIESVSKVGLAIRGAMGVQSTAATYGETGSASISDVGKGIFGMEIGAYESAGNILSGQGTWQDYVGMAMMVAPVGQGKRDLLDQKNKPTEDGTTGNKTDDADTQKTDEDAALKAKDIDADNAKKDGEHDAYESPPKLDDVPGIKEFESWFDNLTTEQFDQVWSDPKLKNKVQARIRHPGGLHEWLMCSRANVFKKWGVSMGEIKNLRTKISDVIFKNPPGRHGGPGSTKAHNEILDIIDNSKSYNEFKDGLIDWADNRLEGGSDALPKGFFD